jgi:hypothetical protein
VKGACPESAWPARLGFFKFFLGTVTALLTCAGLAFGFVSCNPNRFGDADADSVTPDAAAAFFGPYSDLPKAPVGAGGIRDELLGSLSSAFGSAMSSPTGGPCLSEPSIGALYPNNFNPPLFEWKADGAQNVFELRLHVDNQVNDLVVYTDQTSYTLPWELWTLLGQNSRGHDVQITLRGGQEAAGRLQGAVSTGTTGSVHIAPVPALGSIVYWWIVPANNSTGLKGFRVGDRGVKNILSPQSITYAGKPTACIGCHTSSPDGLLAFFSRADPPFSIDARRVNGSSGAPPAGQVTQNALQNLSRTNQNLPTLSKAHYGTGDAVVVSVMSNMETSKKWELVWTDLLATSGGTGIIARTGDPNSAATPQWSHNGSTIIYTSSPTLTVTDGRLGIGNGDIWTVPYSNRKGGQAQPLPGVNTDSRYNQYYPIYSPGDTLVAFNRNPRGTDMYNSAAAEVWVVGAAGGTPTRLAANDPPACTGQKSPGLTNSWPRFAPSVPSEGGKHYYWMVFSSRRRPMGNPQLYLTAIVTKDSPAGEVIDSTYPAIYIPNQPAAENNHTPAWDEFMIPIG